MELELELGLVVWREGRAAVMRGWGVLVLLELGVTRAGKGGR
jgi:hypothetical protein